MPFIFDHTPTAQEVFDQTCVFFATGTDNWYRHALVRNVMYTDGVQFLAEKAKAYWLIDKIATIQMDRKIRAEEFQVWRLVVTNNTATLTCTDGGSADNDGHSRLLHSEHITFTELPAQRDRSVG